ncbi:hypothetical protein, partial [Bacillus cereus]|uniref:hypothetical protein n=1 Tax=Bacillus cereus TaxID=1396 RepID=UPI0018F60EC5
MKLGGYRIVSGEGEHHLEQHADVTDAGVLSIGFGEEQELGAYILTGEDISHIALGYYLTELVRSYMIP